MAYQKSGWGTALLITFIAVLCIWGPQIMHKLDLGTPKTAQQLPGDWVGSFTINGTYKPAIYGETSGPHTGGTLFFHAYRDSPNLDWIDAKGEVCVNGESTARPLQISITHYNSDGTFSTPPGTTPPLGAFPWQGRLTQTKGAPDTLTLGNDIELAIHATLHRGTRAAFRAQSSCAPPPDKD
jgi:hypothetical protein